MSMRERLKETTGHESGYSRAVFTGNFVVLQEFLLEKDNFFWSALRLLDFLLRGFSQVAFANNPISGLLIVISLAFTAPGTLASSTVTGFLGLLLSVLIRDSQIHIANGLTVFNPLLVGAVSYAVIPKIYGSFDAFSILLMILGTIFSIYLTRSLGNNKSPFLAWPFNLAEFALIFVLYTQNNGLDATGKLQPVMGTDNATSDAATGNVSFIVENATGVHIDWGMISLYHEFPARSGPRISVTFVILLKVYTIAFYDWLHCIWAALHPIMLMTMCGFKMFHGVIVSASQLFAVESVVTGSIVYLATLLFSPTTAGFAFLGALIGSLAGLMLGVQINEIYSGLWGYNTYLTGAALGGTLFVINGQTAVATIVAIVYTVIVQYSILFFLKNLQLPVLTLPFILVTSLFLKLRDNPNDKTFPKPMSSSFPEKQRRDYFASRRLLIQKVDDVESTDDDSKDRKGISEPNV